MRLQLIAALVAVAAPAAAEPGADATIRVYTDDDDITVISPAARVGTVAGGAAIEVDAVADAVTGASIDVITSASPRPIDERRLELGVALERPATRALTPSLLLRGSHERDHDAVRAGAGVRLELLGGQLTLDGRYLAGYDAIGSAVDRDFDRRRTLHQAGGGATLVIDPRSLVDVLVEAAASSGYHASPYRRVPITDPASPTPTWIAEEVPSRRRWLAAAVRLRRAIGDAWFAAAGYRAYTDDWSIASHTATVDVHRQIGDRVLAGATTRGYVQDGASFYRSSYGDDGAMPALRTRDRVLGPMRSLFCSLTVDLSLDDDDGWHLLASTGVLATWFPEFPLQGERRAVLLTLSLSTRFEGDLE